MAEPYVLEACMVSRRCQWDSDSCVQTFLADNGLAETLDRGHDVASQLECLVEVRRAQLYIANLAHAPKGVPGAIIVTDCPLSTTTRAISEGTLPRIPNLEGPS